MNSIPVLPWENIGLVGFVLFVGWMVYTGRLIPKATHEREIKTRDDANHFLTEQMALKQDTKAEVIRQNGELLGTAQLSSRLLQAAREAAPSTGSDMT